MAKLSAHRITALLMVKRDLRDYVPRAKVEEDRRIEFS